jgi:hypothetical protein
MMASPFTIRQRLCAGRPTPVCHHDGVWLATWVQGYTGDGELRLIGSLACHHAGNRAALAKGCAMGRLVVGRAGAIHDPPSRHHDGAPRGLSQASR